jgi:hypothetical protein
MNKANLLFSEENKVITLSIRTDIPQQIYKNILNVQITLKNNEKKTKQHFDSYILLNNSVLSN